VKENPLVSYCLFTYNQEAYIRESLEAALAQIYSPLEIVISDDCSTDGTVAVIQEVLAAYSGDHRVIFNVNERNLGIGGHVSKVLLELSNGDYFVLVGGDDISSVKHISTAVQRIREAPKGVLMVDFSARTIDEFGREDPSRKTIGSFDRISGTQLYRLEDYLLMEREIATFAPGRIISRELLNIFGSLSKDCPTEDTVFGLRALLAGGVLRTTDVLIKYRKHSAGVSFGENLNSIPLRGVFEQYKEDIRVALGRDLIDATTECQLQKRLFVEKCLRDSKVNYSVGSALYYLNRIFAELVALVYKRIPALIRYEKKRD